jgi:hypothetical protein
MKRLDDSLIEEMKRVAKEHPHDPAISNMPPEECLWRASFDDEDLDLMLTYEIYDSVKAWHLSISQIGQVAASSKTANQIAWLILGSDTQQIPEQLFPEEVRFIKQYIKQV